MTKEQPRKHLDLSVLTYDTAPGLPYVPGKAEDPEVIAVRRSWPKGSVVLAQQYSGAVIANEIASYKFTDNEARTHTFGILQSAFVTSAWHSYAEKSPDIMRSVVDLPEYAYDPASEGDISQWRETKAGSLHKLQMQLGATASAAFELFSLHKDGKLGNKYTAAQRTFSRKAASSAVRMATMNLLTDEPDERTALIIQNDVRTIGMSLIDQSRYAYESFGNHPSLAQLADDPREIWLRDAPEESIKAFDSAFEDIAQK